MPRRPHDYGFFRVVDDPGYGFVIERATAVVVVPFAADGRLWMIRIRRAPVGAASWEVVGGGVEAGEAVVATARRELAEEGGLVARGRVRALRPALELAPGMGRCPHVVVVAEDVAPIGARPVPGRDEGITSVRAFDRDQVRAMIAGGRVRVLATLAALARVRFA